MICPKCKNNKITIIKNIIENINYIFDNGKIVECSYELKDSPKRLEVQCFKCSHKWRTKSELIKRKIVEFENSGFE